MSPLQIRIMLHYYTTSGDTLEAWPESVVELVDIGMLNYDSDFHVEAHYTITDKGRAYVSKLCSIPIPVETTTYTFVKGEE